MIAGFSVFMIICIEVCRNVCQNVCRSSKQTERVKTMSEQETGTQQRSILSISPISTPVEECERIVLCCAQMPSANLHGADLCCINLAKADLCCADLAEANLCCTTLIQADLCCSDLTGANLCCSNVAGANLTGAKIQNVKWQ
jgi:uncharacterized protein YjbI with pentapeptide repeats